MEKCHYCGKSFVRNRNRVRLEGKVLHSACRRILFSDRSNITKFPEFFDPRGRTGAGHTKGVKF